MYAKNEGKLALAGPDLPGDAPRPGRQTAADELVGALRNLPELPAPDGLWPRVREDYVSRHRIARRRRWTAAACAASILVFVGGWVGLELRSRSPEANRVMLDAEQTVEELAAASRELEEVLQSPRLRAPVLTAAEAVAIIELEDRVTLVDEAISGLVRADSRSPADAREAVLLWSRRVELLDALVEARGVPRNRGDIVYANAEWR